jgi:hypothetical protein
MAALRATAAAFCAEAEASLDKIMRFASFFPRWLKARVFLLLRCGKRINFAYCDVVACERIDGAADMMEP